LTNPKHIHFIAIGGAVMHNLAIDMHHRGYHVTGSDDEIFEPARSRLAAFGLLPEKEGWSPEKIHAGLEAVILGMHARTDNPELIRCRKLGIRMYSFPEYMYEQTRDKRRIVVGGSHGKTTITSMIMHVLMEAGESFDYLVGSKLRGFDTMVSVKEQSTLAVFEGDEYLSSPLDPRPKFHLYRPHIAVISGIAWDHMNVFPTYEIYVDQFRQFIRLIEAGGTLIYDAGDDELVKLIGEFNGKVNLIPYREHPAKVENGHTNLIHADGRMEVSFFGKHNLKNVNAARMVCQTIGVPERLFYQAMASFQGAERRLQCIGESAVTVIFHDFAHAPSKLRVTIDAVREQYPGRSLTACIELHTFSSLNKAFLPQYAGTMDRADEAIVFFNPETVMHKKLPPLSPDEVRNAFTRNDLIVITDAGELKEHLLAASRKNKIFLLMSSGNFSGLDLGSLAQEIIS
jgi:UDP-N-acetylmuramate: L-alanyl-gamma-D-glutamyl-meso-diaminopimelate ligase